MATALAPDLDRNRSAALLRRYSIEITPRDGGKIAALAGRLPAGTPIAVTFLPGEEPSARVLAAKRIREAGFTPVPHISARRLSSAAELDDFLSALSDQAGIDRAFVVAGDLREPVGPYPDALSVIRSGLLARHGIARVGIAGYPDGHPGIAPAMLAGALRDKARALREAGQGVWIATQFGFDADPVLAWLERLRGEGLYMPVSIGVAGPASVQALLRFAARCGVGVSAKVVAKYGFSLTQLLQPAGPGAMIADLAERLEPARHGEAGLHFYPFGGLEKTVAWIGANAA